MATGVATNGGRKSVTGATRKRCWNDGGSSTVHETVA